MFGEAPEAFNAIMCDRYFLLVSPKV